MSSATKAALAGSLVDIAVMALTQDDARRSDVARKAAHILQSAPRPPAVQALKPRLRTKKV